MFHAIPPAIVARAGCSTTVATHVTQSPIELATASGTLFGTLTLPGTLPAPVVLVLAGSGPTDRDGNAPGLVTDAYLTLAQTLAARGIASVRFDKRGIAASAAAGSSEARLRFGDYVADAAAWIAPLRGDPRFDRIVVAGHSEGSLVGMLAVQREPADAFVSLAGAGRRAGLVLREQLAKNVPPDLATQSDAIVASLERGQTVSDPPPALTALFRPSVQPYLISWFAIDPAAEIAKLTIPVTIVQGTADVQVSVTDARSLAAGNPRATLTIVDGMNHLLKHAPDTSTMTSVLRGYENTSLPIEPIVVDAIVAAACSA